MVTRHEQDEAERKEMESLPFVYHPIEPKKRYNDLEFLIGQSGVNDLNKWQEQVKKDPHDPKPREKIYGKLYGNPKMHIGKSPDWVRKEVKLACDDGTKSMAEYVETNLDDFMSLFKGDNLVGLLMSMPLYKTGDAGHDRVVSAVNHLRKMGSIAKEKDVGKMREIVMKSIKERNIPEWARKAAAYFAGDDGYMQFLFKNGDLIRADYNLGKIIKPEGIVNNGMLNGVIKDSIGKAKKAYDKESDEGKKGDIWDNDIEPCYTTIAQAAFPLASERYVKATGRDEEGNEAIETAEREQERHDLGMAA